MDSLDAILILALLCLPGPALLVLLQGTAYKINPKIYQGFCFTVISLLVTLILLPAFNSMSWLPGIFSVLCSLLLGIVAAYAYFQTEAAKLFLSVLSPVIIGFPVMFLFFSPVNQLLLPNPMNLTYPNPHLQNKPPIVLVVFDELPLSTILNPDGNIDSHYFPNLSQFSNQAYWFENAYSIASYTHLAFPAILTGAQPDKNKLPHYQSYPDNLFTLLSHDYHIVSTEHWTRLCPPSVCKNVNYQYSRPERIISTISYELKRALKLQIKPKNLWPAAVNTDERVLSAFKPTWPSSEPIDITAKNSATTQSTIAWLKSWDRLKHNQIHPLSEDRVLTYTHFKKHAEDTAYPPFYFLHLMLPHKPFVYLPDGTSYLQNEQYGPLVNLDDDALAVTSSYRHLLQASYADALFGDLISFLKKKGLYDKAIIVFTADHGVDFHPKGFARKVTTTNLEHTLRIPLLMKLPYQQQAVVDRQIVQHIDIVPTLLDQLNCKNCFKTDGKSLLQPRISEADKPQIVRYVPLPQDTSKAYYAFRVSPLSRKELAAQKYARLAPSQNGELIPAHEYNTFLGQSVSQLRLTQTKDSGNRYRVTLQTPQSLFTQVRLDSKFLPALVNGTLVSKQKITKPMDLAIVLNGKISAVTTTFKPHHNQADFSVLLPQKDFQPGNNTLRFLMLQGSLPHLEIQEISQQP